MRTQFNARIQGLDSELKKIDISLNEFLQTVNTDFNSLIDKVILMKDNMHLIL